MYTESFRQFKKVNKINEHLATKRADKYFFLIIIQPITTQKAECSKIIAGDVGYLIINIFCLKMKISPAMTRSTKLVLFSVPELFASNIIISNGQIIIDVDTSASKRFSYTTINFHLFSIVTLCSRGK